MIFDISKKMNLKIKIEDQNWTTFELQNQKDPKVLKYFIHGKLELNSAMPNHVSEPLRQSAGGAEDLHLFQQHSLLQQQ